MLLPLQRQIQTTFHFDNRNINLNQLQQMQDVNLTKTDFELLTNVANMQHRCSRLALPTYNEAVSEVREGAHFFKPLS